MTTDLATFRATLRHWREYRRWSQGQLARLAGVDESLVNRLESGLRPPTRDTIAKLAAALDIPDLHDEWLILAGFLPDSPTAMLRAEPIAAELYDALTGGTISPVVADMLRSQVATALALASLTVTPAKGAHP